VPQIILKNYQKNTDAMKTYYTFEEKNLQIYVHMCVCECVCVCVCVCVCDRDLDVYGGRSSDQALNAIPGGSRPAPAG
jgi:hypothetical protein